MADLVDPQNDRIPVEARARRKEVRPGLLDAPRKSRQMSKIVAVATSACGGGRETTLVWPRHKPKSLPILTPTSRARPTISLKCASPLPKNAIDSAGGSNAPPSPKWMWREDGASGDEAKLAQSMFDDGGFGDSPGGPQQSGP